jgi:multicomponent Na+:H+ antiporter subunit E
MTLFIWNILLAFIWTAATGPFTVANLLVGFLLGYLVLWLAYRAGDEPPGYFRRVRRLFAFAAYFVVELVRASLRVAHDVVTPKVHMRPGVIAIPLDAETDAEITALANVITLTPGTLSLDLSEDRRHLYIHAMFIEDADRLRDEIKRGFERQLLEVMR